MMIHADTLIQALGDRTRLRALILLRQERVLCVCELTAALGVSQPKMSRHLAALRALGVVEDVRVANRVFYRIEPDLPAWARQVLDAVAQGLATTPEYRACRRRLHAFPNRPQQRPDCARDTGEAEAGGGKEIRHAV